MLYCVNNNIIVRFDQNHLFLGHVLVIFVEQRFHIRLVLPFLFAQLLLLLTMLEHQRLKLLTQLIQLMLQLGSF